MTICVCVSGRVYTQTYLSLLEDLGKINLSKYVSEAVASIVLESKKMASSDVKPIAEVCMKLHLMYADFGSEMARTTAKCMGAAALLGGKSVAAKATNAMRATAAGASTSGNVGGEDDALVLLSGIKKRTMLKVIMEFVLIGVEAQKMLEIVRVVVREIAGANAYSADTKDAYQAKLSLLVSFAKHAPMEFLGLSPPSAPAATAESGGGDSTDKEKTGCAGASSAVAAEEEAGAALCIDEKYQIEFREAVRASFTTACTALLEEHQAVVELESRNVQEKSLRGELREEDSATYEKARKSFEALQRSVGSLAEILDEAMPELPDANVTRIAVMDPGSLGSGVELSGSGGDDEFGPFDYKEEHHFYQVLPDLKDYVPPVLLGEKKEEGDQPQEETSGTAGSQGPKHVEQDQQNGGASTETSGMMASSSSSSSLKAMDTDESRTPLTPAASSTTGGGGVDIGRSEAWFARLSSAGSIDATDKMAVDFCFITSKGNRRRLVRGLSNLQRADLNLLPYMVRIVAILHPYFKDIAPALGNAAEEDFNAQMLKKHATTVDARVRDVQILGELCKFKMVSPGIVFACLKSCTDDFIHHNIEVACQLLETCGRYLYKNPETSVRMSNTLDTIMRLKKAKNLDQHHTMLLDNAFFTCKPPERPALRAKKRSELHEYIRHLMFVTLSSGSLSRMVSQIRKLPWARSEPYIVRCVLKVHKFRFSHIHLVAELVAKLGRYHDTLLVTIVDELLEEIRAGLERTSPPKPQRLVACCKLLAELYNTKVLDTPVLFDTLFFILSFGYGASSSMAAAGDSVPRGSDSGSGASTDKGTSSSSSDVQTRSRRSVAFLDPSDDFTRVRWINTILSTSVRMFAKGKAKARMDTFLLYYQRYFLSKTLRFPSPSPQSSSTASIGAMAATPSTALPAPRPAAPSFVPLPLDVEFELCDVFEELRPSMARAGDFQEAVLAVQAMEEKARRESEEEAQKRHEEAGSASGRVVASNGHDAPVVGESMVNDNEGQGISDDDEYSDDDDDSDDDDMEDDDSSVDDSEDDDDEEDEDEDEDEEADQVRFSLDDDDDDDDPRMSRQTEAERLAELEFDRELRALTGENDFTREDSTMAQASSNARGGFAPPSSGGGGGHAPTMVDTTKTVAFKMLVKRHVGSKKSSVLHLPVAQSVLARSALEDEEREMRERSELKRLVLKSVEEDEEAQRLARIQQHQKVVFSNAGHRDRDRDRDSGGSGGGGGHRHRRGGDGGSHHSHGHDQRDGGGRKKYFIPEL